MSQMKYNPYSEANSLGLTIRMAAFRKLNSFLMDGVIYLKQNLSRIEKRCTLTYEIVHYLYKATAKEQNTTLWYTKQTDAMIKQEAARKLVCPQKLYELIEGSCELDEIAKELEVTKEVIYHYFQYCKQKQLSDTLEYQKVPVHH